MYPPARAPLGALELTIRWKTWRRDDDARPENASRDTEDEIMKDDLRVSSKGIYFAPSRPLNRIDREQHGIVVGRPHNKCEIG